MKDIKAINKAIDSIATKGKALDALIQATAVDVLEHFQTHRDTGVVNRLYLAMPKGSRGLALADWLLKFVAVKVNTDKETKSAKPFVPAKNAKGEWLPGVLEAMLAPGRLEEAAATLWHDLKKEKALDEVFDLRTAVKAMLRKIETHAKVEHFDRAAVVAMAASVGIAESDVPTKPGGKAKLAAMPEGEEAPV